MVIYYHTRSHIFAVANGYCSTIMDTRGNIQSLHIVGSRLMGGVDGLTGPVLAEHNIVAGMRLKFEIGGSSIVTEPVELVERAASLSIPPALRPSLPPESSTFVVHSERIPTLPEILYPEEPKKFSSD